MADFPGSALFTRRSHLAALAAVALLVLSLCWLRLPLCADTAGNSLATRIAHNQTLIAEAAQRQLTPVQVGNLWAQVASDYHDLANFDRAEDAYSHALRLYEPQPEAKVAYVVTLGNLGSLYTMTQRYDAAINCHKRAMAALQGTNDPLMMAREQGHLAEVYLAMGKGKDAVRYSAPAVDAVMHLTLATAEDRGSILVSHAYALCLTSHCDQGLDEARQAMEIVTASFSPDSFAFGQTSVALGFAESRTGAGASAEEHFRDGVRVLRSQLPSTHPLLLQALEMYHETLARNHHDTEAHQIAEEQKATLERTRNHCGSCTVSITGLRGW